MDDEYRAMMAARDALVNRTGADVQAALQQIADAVNRNAAQIVEQLKQLRDDLEQAHEQRVNTLAGVLKDVYTAKGAPYGDTDEGFRQWLSELDKIDLEAPPEDGGELTKN